MKRIQNSHTPSGSNEGSFDEDWIFLWDRGSSPIIEEGWASEMLFYEMARELESEKHYSGDPQGYLKKITKGQFPATPFLKLSKQEQNRLVEQLREPGSVFRQVEQLASRPVFLGRVERQLTDDAENALEHIAQNAAEEEARKWPGLQPSMLRQGSNPGERAAEEARNGLLGKGEAIFDEAKCTVTIQLDLDFPDHVIEKEFGRLLDEIRTTNTPPSKENETRGKKNDPRLKLSSLAAWRMKQRFGSFDKINHMLTVKRKDDGIPDLPISSQGGWDKAVTRGKEMVERFRQWYPCGPA